jgi:beta-mannosidase
MRAGVAVLTVLAALSAAEVILHGSDWVLTNANKSIKVSATVPGVVHLDLLKAGIIPEPYYRYGELNLSWVHLEPHWTYSLTFDGAELVRNKTVLLRCEGLDTVATLTMNGEIIGSSMNMWHRPAWDVTGALVAGNNTLEVRFDSPSQTSKVQRDAYPYEVQGMYITPFQFPYCDDCPDCFDDPLWKTKCNTTHDTRKFLRKAQAHWGWDWVSRPDPCVR